LPSVLLPIPPDFFSLFYHRHLYKEYGRNPGLMWWMNAAGNSRLSDQAGIAAGKIPGNTAASAD
jgi:hypothetical protein